MLPQHTHNCWPPPPIPSSGFARPPPACPRAVRSSARSLHGPRAG